MYLYFFFLFGGILIGIVVVLLMGSLGWIIGISGIVSGVFIGDCGDCGWWVVFIVGLIVGLLLLGVFG